MASIPVEVRQITKDQYSQMVVEEYLEDLYRYEIITTKFGELFLDIQTQECFFVDVVDGD